MNRPVTRREFVSVVSMATAAAAWRPRLSWAEPSGSPSEVSRIRVLPFPLDRVRLRPGLVLDALMVNRRHLLDQDPDRLLHMFRVTAGLPSSATPLGGWEAPDNELRGHFTGHYLSALSLLGAATGDVEAKARGERMVGELAKCQAAVGNGYLSAFPEELFDRLRAGKPAWAPFYTLHKIMAGLLDTHMLSGNAQALEVVHGMAKWTARWVQPLGEDAMARVLEREYGGMNEVLYNLAALEPGGGFEELAHRFDHERFFAPLALGRDELAGLHANTNVPKIIGAARRYELTGERRYRDVAEFFWSEVTGRRSFCTGGTSDGEGWGELGKMSTDLSGYSEESCVTYNMLKLSRHLFGWSPEARMMDFYERAWLNGTLGTQHPRDGAKLYYLPLASGYWKLFGTPLHDYWCCSGTMAEAFAKLGDSLYFQDDDGLYVNLFAPSELDYREKGIRLVQDTRYPEEETVRLLIHAARPQRFALRVRIPAWVAHAPSGTLNGRTLESFASPGSYLVLDRVWREGDRLEITLPMGLRMEPMSGDDSLQAILYGPVVLAGRLGTEGLTPETLRAEPTRPRTVPEYKAAPLPVTPLKVAKGDLVSRIEPVPGRPLEFRLREESREILLAPLSRIFDERFAVYWKVRSE